MLSSTFCVGFRVRRIPLGIIFAVDILGRNRRVEAEAEVDRVSIVLKNVLCSLPLP